MKTAILGVSLAVVLGATGYAQHHHGHAPAPPAHMHGQGVSPEQLTQMKSMMGMMQKMIPMMQKMQQSGATPEARAEIMRQMAPMMQSMMPMMQGMMNGANATPGAHADHTGAAPHVRAYAEAMDRMHGPMNSGVTAADPDEGFVRGMIPHHQGAIDMAKIVLQYGKDEQVRKWANDVIREQQREIGEMEAWLKKNTK